VAAVPLDPSSVLLTDRVAVVTGAARGLGEAIALVLARFGATVAICDRDADGLARVEAQVGAVASGVFDVRDAAAVDGFLAGLDRVDVLVNNAGGTFFAPFLDVNERGEQALVAENFGQVATLIRRTVPLMPEGGAIVNVTSIEAHQAAPGFAVYAAMKAAVESLTKTLALELAPRGIRVNAVAPDAIPTAGDDTLRADVAGGAGFEPAVDPPLGFLGDPEDAAGAVLFLAGDLSRFVTGTTIHVDGGNRAAGGWRRVRG
jgi:NAD(P)-dependent dehydrogenase (short-subunit alcohol dehydrogenase family)